MAVVAVLAYDFSTGKQEKAKLLGYVLVRLLSHFEILSKCWFIHSQMFSYLIRQFSTSVSM